MEISEIFLEININYNKKTFCQCPSEKTFGEVKFQVEHAGDEASCHHRVGQSAHWSDLDNRCVGKLYEKEGCEQHEYSL